MAEEQKEENPIDIIEGLLFDNKKKIKNGDYITLMNTLKKLKEKKDEEEGGWRMHKITYFERCEMNDSDGDIKHYYDTRVVLGLINTNMEDYEKEINDWAIGCGFGIDEKTCRWFRLGRNCNNNYKNIGKTGASVLDCGDYNEQGVFIQEKIIIKIELFNQ